MRNVQLDNEATHLRTTAEALGKLLEEKCLAYGGAHNRQTDIWAAVLKQYEEERDGQAGYWLPDALIYHMPRLTRIFDRIMRIVSNPVADTMGEDPWRDLAGDALAGCVMPKPPRGCYDVECEMGAGHAGEHRKCSAAGIHRWGDGGSPEGMASPRGFDPGLDT